jgi:hypothetical protein
VASLTSGERVLLACGVLTVWSLLAISSALSAGSTPRLAARWEGGSQTLVCSVPRHANNRWLDMGVPLQATETIQLEGENAPITFRLTLPHLDCNLEDEPNRVTGYCQVLGLGKPAQARASIPCFSR